MNTIIKNETTNHAQQQAIAAIGSIRELIATLNNATDDTRGDAEEAIQEYPLSVQVRCGWHSPGSTPEAEEYEVLISTGGPAVRVHGSLDSWCQPCDARIEYQDWGTPWTEHFATEEEEAYLLVFAQQFFFGETA